MSGVPPRPLSADAIARAVVAGLDQSQLGQEARALLHERARLAQIDVEAHHEKRESLWQRFLKFAGQSGSLSLSVATTLLLVIILIVLGRAVVQAWFERGLVVEAFSVPPDAAAKGLTGQVLASQILDRIVYMQSKTVVRAASNSLQVVPPDVPVKVEISSATITLDAIYTYMRVMFGHESFVSGELVEMPLVGADKPAAFTLTARTGDGATACSGTGTQIDAVIADVAGCVYRTVQPYRYAAFIATQQKFAEATLLYKQVIRSGSVTDRAWAYEALGYRVQTDGLPPDELSPATGDGAKYLVAISYYNDAINGVGGVGGIRNFALAYRDLIDANETLGYEQKGYAATRTLLNLISKGPTPDIGPVTAGALLQEYKATLADDLGDYSGASAIHLFTASTSPDEDDRSEGRVDYVEDLANQHDANALNHLNGLDSDALMQVNASLEHWDVAASLIDAAQADCDADCLPSRDVFPVVALALAMIDKKNGSGFGDAETLIGGAPRDCYSCVRALAQIAQLDGKVGDPAQLHADAVQLAPSLPFAYSEWGEWLLRQGRFGEAIAQFTTANRKGPRFADPLELWGEALIAQNRSDLALAKFSEAAGYAPNWARLHFKWGEALLWLGNRADADKQFAIAAGLGLNDADADTLERLLARHG